MYVVGYLYTSRHVGFGGIKWLLHFIPILFLIPFIIHLFNIYSMFTYFAISVTVGMYTEAPAEAQ